MVGKVFSAAVNGISAELVEVQADVAAGIPSFEMTGNLSGTVKEAKERVRIALKNSKIRINPSRITINLIPANLRKDGPHFDLAMAIGIYLASGGSVDGDVRDKLFAGELGLDGKVCPVKAILPMVLCAKNNNLKYCFVPKENEQEAGIVPDIKIIGVTSLSECIDILTDMRRAKKPKVLQKEAGGAYPVDFAEIRGQHTVKRAVVVAAASMHNILFIGPPGAGKSMIAARIPTVLPTLNFEEMLRITSTYSVAGLLKDGNFLIDKRPFRTPHHSVTVSAFTGGGIVPGPGEMSLADQGVLFLDELNLFQNDVIDSMRLPLEQHKIYINRIHGAFEYPADFMLVAAMNPCRCGFFPDRSKCHCSEQDIRKYFGKISKPVIDRIDMCIQVNKSSYDEINDKNSDEISSEMMRNKVENALAVQRERYKGTLISLNSRLQSNEISRYCNFSSDADGLLKAAFNKYDMSARGYYRTVKVARTIADLDESSEIKESHVCEALGYKLVGGIYG